MTAPVRYSRLRAAARLIMLVAAIGLTTWGVCLIAFSGTMRGTRLGIPIAFWGVLVGYTAIRTTASKGVAPEPGSTDLADGRGVEPPASAELVRERDDAVRHEHELRLEVMLRRELEQVLRTELAGLRRDVAELRGDVLDAVDGRLRMERVEITRIIGSNLAALQDDGRIPVRAPAADVTLVAPGVGAGRRSRREVVTSVASGSLVSPAVSVSRPPAPGPVGSLPTSAVPDPGRAPSAFAEVASRRAGSPPVTGAEPTAGPEPAARPVSMRDLDPDVESAPLTDPAAKPPRESAARPGPDAGAEPETSVSNDPFASLPRLSEFRLPDLPPGVSLGQPVAPAAEPEPTTTDSAPAESTPAASAPSDPEPSATEPSATETVTRTGYVGRRRHADADSGPDETAANREGAAPATDSTPAGATGGGGRVQPATRRR